MKQCHKPSPKSPEIGGISTIPKWVGTFHGNFHRHVDVFVDVCVDWVDVGNTYTQ